MNTKKKYSEKFNLKLEELKSNKEQIYALMQQQASDPETIAYYEQQAKELGDIDIEIMDLEEVDETAYLLKNPNNAKILKKSINEIEHGKTVSYTIDELKTKQLKNAK